MDRAKELGLSREQRMRVQQRLDGPHVMAIPAGQQYLSAVAA